VGDPVGMSLAPTLASGMGGMRAAGDLVARMQMTRGMRLREAKEYVAGRLGVSTLDLVDPVVMHDVRAELGLGRITVQELTYADQPYAIEAKFRISEVLDIPINSVERFADRAGLGRPSRAVAAG
jgi:dimethylamine---corrinoid protein Co-methyltransferase